MPEPTTQAQGDKGQAEPIVTPTQAKGENQAQTVSYEEHQKVLSEKNELAKQIRLIGKGVKTPAGNSDETPADPNDVAALREKVARLEAKDGKVTERHKQTVLKTAAESLGFTGERTDAFIAIVKEKLGTRIQVNDDDTVTFTDTAEGKVKNVADYMKELAPKYDFLKPAISTPNVKGFTGEGSIGGNKSYTDLSTEESLKLDPETRRRLAYEAYKNGK